MSPDFFFHINHSIPFLQKQGNFDNPKDLLRILVTVHTPLSRDIQAKIPLPQAIWNEFWLRYCERSEQLQSKYYRQVLT